MSVHFERWCNRCDREGCPLCPVEDHQQNMFIQIRPTPSMEARILDDLAHKPALQAIVASARTFADVMHGKIDPRIFFGNKPVDAPTEHEKENSEMTMNPDRLNQLNQLASERALVAAGNERKGRLVRVYGEPVAVVRTLEGDDHYVPARTVRPLSEDEAKLAALAEREQRAAQREQAANQAMSMLRELLADAVAEDAFGRVVVPTDLQVVIRRLADIDDAPEVYETTTHGSAEPEYIRGE